MHAQHNQYGYLASTSKPADSSRIDRRSTTPSDRHRESGHRLNKNENNIGMHKHALNKTKKYLLHHSLTPSMQPWSSWHSTTAQFSTSLPVSSRITTLWVTTNMELPGMR